MKCKSIESALYCTQNVYVPGFVLGTTVTVVNRQAWFLPSWSLIYWERRVLSKLSNDKSCEGEGQYAVRICNSEPDRLWCD